MRKILSFCLVLVMILCSVSVAFATEFSDTNTESTRLLSGLGVINGYPDGTFRADNPITRAEFAAMVIRSLGFGIVGKSETTFEDVPMSHWASGYINYAHSLGIIFGRTETIFDPSANITNNEAIAMVVRALGYSQEYMAGSYPTSHINVALGLGILDGLPTGGAPATRGMVSDLIFNALGENTISYNARGAIITGATLLERLGGQAYNNGQPFVVTGEETVADGVKIKEYVGKYVEAYADKDDANKIIAISKVLSTTITGKISFVGIFDNIATGTVGDYKVLKDTVTPGAFEYLINGEAQANAENQNINNTETYTLEVELDGKYIKNIYSVQSWTVSAAARLTEDDLEEIKEHNSLLNEDFKITSSDKIDTTSFVINGVSGLDKLAVNHVVAVYSDADGIVRIDVGASTVVGLVDTIYQNGDMKIGTKTYSLSTLPGALTSIAVGTNGKFYLDANGDIYDYIGLLTASDTHYAMVLAVEDGNPAALNSINNKLAEIQLFNDEDDTSVYSISADVADITGYYTKATRSFTGGENPAIVDQLVEYSLNSKKQIKSLKVIATTPVAANTKVTKSGTYGGNVLTEDTVIFGGANQDYSLVARRILLDAVVATGSVYNKEAGVITVAIVNGVSNEQATYSVFTDWSIILSDTARYNIDAITTEGKSVAYHFDGDITTIATNTAVLYKVSVDKNNVMTPTPASVVYATDSTTPTTKTVLNTYDDIYGLKADGGNYFLTKSVVVLAFEDDKWTIKPVSSLNKRTDVTITLADIESTPDGVYDIVFVKAN